MRIHRQTVALGALAAAATISLVSVLKVVAAYPDTLGKDLPAYVEAARRLIDTGTPYSTEIHAGQFDRFDIATGYLYPPPLAQVFVPLSYVPAPLLIGIWTLAQAVLLIVLLPLVFRRYGGATDRAHTVGILLAGVAFIPNLMAVVIGNVSGWIAIAIGVMLLARPAGRSSLAAGMMWIKLTPGVFVIGALVDRSSRLLVVIASLVILAISFALSPAAWLDWFEVLPVVSGFYGQVPFTANLAPSNVLNATGYPLLATIASVGVPALFLGAMIVAAFRGNLAGWVTAGVGVYLSATGTSWDHYFAALSPIVVAAWPEAPRALRTSIVSVLIWLGPLRFLETQPIYQLVGLGLWLAFLVGAVIVFTNLVTNLGRPAAAGTVRLTFGGQR